jgi:hypothetical protein
MRTNLHEKLLPCFNIRTMALFLEMSLLYRRRPDHFHAIKRSHEYIRLAVWRYSYLPYRIQARNNMIWWTNWRGSFPRHQLVQLCMLCMGEIALQVG